MIFPSYPRPRPEHQNLNTTGPWHARVNWGFAAVLATLAATTSLIAWAVWAAL